MSSYQPHYLKSVLTHLLLMDVEYSNTKCLDYITVHRPTSTTHHDQTSKDRHPHSIQVCKTTSTTSKQSATYTCAYEDLSSPMRQARCCSSYHTWRAELPGHGQLTRSSKSSAPPRHQWWWMSLRPRSTSCLQIQIKRWWCDRSSPACGKAPAPSMSSSNSLKSMDLHQGWEMSDWSTTSSKCSTPTWGRAFTDYAQCPGLGLSGSMRLLSLTTNGGDSTPPALRLQHLRTLPQPQHLCHSNPLCSTLHPLATYTPAASWPQSCNPWT